MCLLFKITQHPKHQPRGSGLMRALLLSTVSMALLVTAPSSPTFAQSTQGASDGIAEILVTARRVEERLQDAPVSVLAFTAEEIEARGAQNIRDLVKATPSLIIDTRTNAADFRPAVRGVSSYFFDPYRNRAIVGFFIDGAPVIANLTDLPLGDVERVEVIRGPQSALFGRATYAGAINVVPKIPTDSLQGKAEAMGATRDTWKGQLSLAGPTGIEGLGFRIGGSVYNYGGEHRNIFSNRIYGSERAYSGSVGLRFEPNDSFDLRLNYVYSADRNLATGRVVGVYDEIGWTCGELEAKDLRINIRDDAWGAKGPGYDQDTHIITAGATISASVLDIVLNTAWNKQDYEQRSNQSRVVSSVFDTAALPTGSQATDVGTFESFSQEVRAQSNTKGPFKWLFGISYYEETFDLDRLRGAQILDYPDRDRAFNYGVFGSLAYTAFEALTFTVEGRYQQDDVKRYNSRASGTTKIFETDEVGFKRFLPRAIIEYQVNDDLRFYASYAEGARPGATRLASDNGQIVREERTKNFEFGARAEWLDGRLRTNLTAYYIDWIDIFAETAREAVQGDPTTLRVFRINQGDARIKGLEANITWRPIRQLTLDANYAYTDAAFKDGFNTREAFDLLGQASRAFLVGKRPRYVPEHAATGSVTWADEITADWSYRFRADLNYTGDRFGTELNTDRFGESKIVNVSAGLTFGNFDLEAWGKNIFDDDTILSSGRFLNLDATPGVRLAGTRSQNYIAEGTLPRGPQWGVTARYRF
jgi:iron complex outermembrane recepter protein